MKTGEPRTRSLQGLAWSWAVLPGAGIPAPNRYSWSQVSPRSPPPIYPAKELKAFFPHSVRINREPQQHLSGCSAQPPGNIETANFISLPNAAAPTTVVSSVSHCSFRPSQPCALWGPQGSLLSETLLSTALAFAGLVAQHKTPC